MKKVLNLIKWNFREFFERDIVKPELWVTSWSLKARFEIHELRVQIHEFMNLLINENPSKQP